MYFKKKFYANVKIKIEKKNNEKCKPFSNLSPEINYFFFLCIHILYNTVKVQEPLTHYSLHISPMNIQYIKDVRSLHQSDFYILSDNSYKNAFKFPFLNIF